MNPLALILLLGGLFLALYSLAAEWAAARSEPARPTLPARPKRQVRNPWADAMFGPRNRGPEQRVTRRRTDPKQLERDLSWNVARFRELISADRMRAKEAWDHQLQIEEQLHEADRTLLQAHLDALDRQRRDTRRRVLLEMFGLLLVGIGTALS